MPLAGRDLSVTEQTPTRINFNPRAPCGARRFNMAGKKFDITFQSTRPLRGATSRMAALRLLAAFQSTRPLRGATWLITCDGGLT